MRVMLAARLWLAGLMLAAAAGTAQAQCDVTYTVQPGDTIFAVAERHFGDEALRVVISKTHARGTTHLYRINTGLSALRDGGQYGEIVERHMQIFWDQLR